MELAIRQERRDKGWTQADVASNLDITEQAYQLIETAKRNPSYEVLVKLENLFGKSHRELFAPATDNPSIAEKESKGEDEVVYSLLGSSERPTKKSMLTSK